MHIIDSHFHWWPRSIFEKLCKRGSFPKARVNTHGGYDYMRRADSGQHLNSWAEWFDLDKQFEYLDRLGHQFSVILSIGPFSVAFSDMPVEEGCDYALMWNEAMADAQKKYPGRVWASAAVPLQDLAASSNTLRVRRRPTHYVDLAKVRAQGDYLSTLGPQTRSAIRRTARKLVAQFGTLSTTVANDADTKLVYFRALIRLHEAHWRSKEGQAGAFSDARIVAFHEHLLATGAGSVQLLCLSAGEQVVGYAYNVVHRGIVYFYQAGVDYPHCAGYGSPGLLLLTQAVEHAIAMGHERFEFMAGSADYKRKLGAGQGELLWLSLDRPSVGSQLRNAARWLRARAGTAVR